MEIIGWILLGVILVPLAVFLIACLVVAGIGMWREFLGAFILIGLVTLGIWLAGSGTWGLLIN